MQNPSPPQDEAKSQRYVLKETVVSSLPKGTLIMAAMLLSSEYELPDGTKRTGPTGSVRADPKVRVGEGSEFVFAGDRYRVVSVTKVKGERGRMVIEQVAETE